MGPPPTTLPGPGPHSLGLGLGHQSNNWDKTLFPSLQGFPKHPSKSLPNIPLSLVIPGKSHHTGGAKRRALPSTETQC